MHPDGKNTDVRKLQFSYDTSKAELNMLSKQIGELIQKKSDASVVAEVKAKTSALKLEIQNSSAKFEELDLNFEDENEEEPF